MFSEKIKIAVKARDLYGLVFEDVKKEQAMKALQEMDSGDNPPPPGTAVPAILDKQSNNPSNALILHSEHNHSLNTAFNPNSNASAGASSQTLQQLPRKAPSMPKPKWHAPWKLKRVIAGHLGWVRSVAVEPGNEWFATGAADRVIKIWDLASGQLKVSLTGHVSAVRGLAVSDRHPYLFSCGEDRQVKCWDLEYNKVQYFYFLHFVYKDGLVHNHNFPVMGSFG